MMLRLGIDMDQTLLDTYSSWQDTYEELGKEHGHGRLLRSSGWDDPILFCKKCFDHCCKSPDVLKKATLLHGALDALNELDLRDYEMHLISHRLTALTPVATKLLRDLEVRDFFKSVQWHFETKAKTCRRLKIGVMVDDSPNVHQDLRRNGVMGVIFDQPYNRGVGGPRVFSWRQVPEVLEQLLTFKYELPPSSDSEEAYAS